MNINILSGGGPTIPPVGIAILLTPKQTEDLKRQNISQIQGIIPTFKLSANTNISKKLPQKPTTSAISITQNIANELIDQGVESILGTIGNYPPVNFVTPLSLWLSSTVTC